MLVRACIAVLCCSLVYGQSGAILKRVPSLDGIRGAALAGDGRLFTWGDSLRSWTVPELESSVLAVRQFGEGGCLVDLDGDGTQEFIGKEGAGLGQLTWSKPPDWKPVLIDDQFDTHGCLEATLFGRKGVLVIQRYMQVRFYERAASSPWPHREIYSIYTPSRQTGLLLRDIDGDGRTDIVCGNYWIQSPERFDLPWHIFAINTWFEDPDSAMLTHAFRDGELFIAQAHMPDARAALFRKPDNPRKLWGEKRIEIELHRVHAAAMDSGTIFFGESNGSASRIFALDGGEPRLILEGVDSIAILPAGQAILSAGPKEIVLWRYRRR